MPSLKNSVRAAIGDVNTERVKRVVARATADDWSGGIFKVAKSITPASVTIVEYMVPGKDTFFGYYDKCPQSADGSKILAGVIKSRWTGYEDQPPMTIGYFDYDDGRSFHPLADTEAWCWQLGSLLTWLRQDTSDKVIFNCMLRDRYAARIVDVDTRKIEGEISWPIYNVAPDGNFAVSCCFSRLHRLRRGYGFPQIPDPHASLGAPDDEGVWLLDLRNNTRRLLYSLRQLSDLEPRETMRGAMHYINHLQFNRTGDRFLFHHLWVKEGQWYFRMYTSARDGTNLFLLHDRYVSHYCWSSPDTMVVYAEGPDDSTCYNEFQDFVGLVRPLFVEHALSNGHGTFCADGDVMLTDTYPDSFGYQHLFLIHADGALREVGKFFHPEALCMDKRCDLHPRWGRSGTEVFIDTAAWGRRKILKLDVSQVLSELREASGTRPAIV